MTRKKTRRKHWPLVNPVRMAILGAAPASNDLLDEIRRRSGEQLRPEGERSYLRRLLDMF